MTEPAETTDLEAGPTPGTMPQAVLAPDEVLMPDEAV
jgi:hypothetical protein